MKTRKALEIRNYIPSKDILGRKLHSGDRVDVFSSRGIIYKDCIVVEKPCNKTNRIRRAIQPEAGVFIFGLGNHEIIKHEISFKGIKWGSDSFDEILKSSTPKDDKTINNNYLIHSQADDTKAFKLFKISESDTHIVSTMLESGTYRYATESEVCHWRTIKKLDSYLKTI